MRWSDELTLIAVIPFDDPAEAVNENGYGLPGKEIKTDVFGNKKSVGFSEFFKAQMAGYKEELKFDVYTAEYNGEGLVEHEGKRYKILRSYVDPKSGGDITELTLSDLSQGVNGDGNV